jgi:hypothetical protein
MSASIASRSAPDPATPADALKTEEVKGEPAFTT